MGIYKLEPVLSDVSVAINLHRNVKNIKELKQSVENGTINAALIKANLVLDVFQLLVGVNKAFYLQSQKKMKTRNVFSEILFNISPSKKITECFKLFGVDNDTNDVVIVSLQEDQEKINNLVDSNLTDLTELPTVCDKDAIIKLYKITEFELEASSLLDCVVSLLASKDVR